jgi:8-oxo-dGTP pyrophosphatase MutT (NUDIX family)
MKLNIKEVNNIQELKDIIKSHKDVPQDFQVAVIVYAFDKDNKIIFQRRGMGCRDERLKLETIGGRVKEDDLDFRTALKREIVEEVGENAKINIEEFITATFATTFDNRYNKEQSWIYLVYKGKLEAGELEIAEPDKCIGYERYKMGEVDETELSRGAKETYHIVCEKYIKYA